MNRRAMTFLVGPALVLLHLCACSSIDSVWRIAPETKTGPSANGIPAVKTAQYTYEVQASARFGARTAVGPCLLPIFSRDEAYFNGQLVRLSFRLRPAKTGQVIRLRKRDLVIRGHDGRTHTPSYTQAFRLEGSSRVFDNWNRGPAGIQVDAPVRFEMEYASARYGELDWFSFQPRFRLGGKEFTGRPVKLIPRVSRTYNLFQNPFAAPVVPR